MRDVNVKKNLFVLIAALSLVVGGCGQSPNPETNSSSSSSATPAANVSMNKSDYPVFPDADAGADPSVPAEQGGKGFTGQGWETNTSFDLIGDPRALKGGAFRGELNDFPSTIRLEGPEANTYFNFGITLMAYESLLAIHPTTQEYIPSLATHWQISPDKMTYRYRINPNARFSDGTPVTSEDVVASYDFRMDKTLQSPMTRLNLEKLDRPVAESKYIVRVHAKKLNWRNFLEFSTNSMLIFPAHVLKALTGEKYIKDYNYKLLPGTGPYVINDSDLDKGKTITVRRRNDYWAAKARANVGLNNFDELRFVVVRDENLAFEMFKKGDLDSYPISRARQWVEETNFDTVQRGLVQKRKIFNNEPQGFQGMAFNTRRAPFDDIRVRKALTLLMNRKQLIEKIMFNQYVPQNSYESGSPYENPDNPKNEYNPEEALKLLADAGWNSRDSQGRLVKNGVPLQIELLYDVKTFEPHLTVYQEDLRKVGINLNLRLITFETQFQLLNQRRFQMALMAWGSSPFPDPETMWHSSLADVDSSNNFTGFKNARLDQLCGEYDRAFEMKDRIRVLREIDGILTNAYQYVLLWDAPYTRVIYWNKFGTPLGYISSTGDYYGGYKMYGVFQMWWNDPAKNARLQRALRDPSTKLEVGPAEDRYWLDYSEREKSSQR
jgi:microcin C transport system substrate-binding protein